VATTIERPPAATVPGPAIGARPSRQVDERRRPSGRRPATAHQVSRFRLTHVDALDGLRGVAVAGVVVFHVNFLSGGFLGVDLFFVLSGFLITSLLVRERLDTGGVRLGAFWARRARRLLPALGGVLVGVAVYAWLFADPTELGRLRGDTLGTVFYFANWRAIFSQQGYWDTFLAPSPLSHTWSLAIEEQFYLLWPVVLGGLLWWRRGSLRAVVGVTAAFAIAGAVWMAVVYSPDDPNRAYLGTDTRIPALLLGACMAAWLQWKGPVRSYRARLQVEVAALVGAVVLVAAWTSSEGSTWILYHGGFFACGVAVVAIIAAITHPVAGPVARLFSFRPLCWLGLISYGLYLWHWPVIVVLNHDRVGYEGLPLSLIQMSVSLALAVASYYLLEQPIRRGGLAAWRWRPLAPLAGLITIVAIVVLTAGAVDPATAIGRSDLDLARLQRQEGQPIALGHPELVVKDKPLPRPSDRPPRLLVAGDSVGFSLGENLTVRPDRWSVDLADRALPSCTIDDQSGHITEARVKPSNGLPGCHLPDTRWADDVERFKPDAALVTFGLPGDPKQIDRGWTGVCDGRYLDLLRTEVDSAVRVLSSKGAIVFVTTMPYVRHSLFGTQLDDPVDCMNRVITASVDASASGRLVRFDSWVCSSRTNCRQQASDGTKLRYDNLHFRDQGATDADTWLVNQIFTP
jgi:peptidoglycan/LPS O-acetylase OafA/YrhL